MENNSKQDLSHSNTNSSSVKSSQNIGSPNQSINLVNPNIQQEHQKIEQIQQGVQNLDIQEEQKEDNIDRIAVIEARLINQQNEYRMQKLLQQTEQYNQSMRNQWEKYQLQESIKQLQKKVQQQDQMIFSLQNNLNIQFQQNQSQNQAINQLFGEVIALKNQQQQTEESEESEESCDDDDTQVPTHNPNPNISKQVLLITNDSYKQQLEEILNRCEQIYHFSTISYDQFTDLGQIDDFKLVIYAKPQEVENEKMEENLIQRIKQNVNAQDKKFIYFEPFTQAKSYDEQSYINHRNQELQTLQYVFYQRIEVSDNLINNYCELIDKFLSQKSTQSIQSSRLQ